MTCSPIRKRSKFQDQAYISHSNTSSWNPGYVSVSAHLRDKILLSAGARCPGARNPGVRFVSHSFYTGGYPSCHCGTF